MPISVNDLANDLHDQAMDLFDDPVKVGQAARAVLSGLDQGNLFAVRRLAEEVAKAMAFERSARAGDMVSVLSRQSAMLEALVEWMTRHGLDSRTLRVSLAKVSCDT
jgi:hypothetical protein